jgi:hypothetical protein
MQALVDVQWPKSDGCQLSISSERLDARWHVNIAFACEVPTEHHTGCVLLAHTHSIDW